MHTKKSTVNHDMYKTGHFEEQLHALTSPPELETQSISLR